MCLLGEDSETDVTTRRNMRDRVDLPRRHTEVDRPALASNALLVPGVRPLGLSYTRVSLILSVSAQTEKAMTVTDAMLPPHLVQGAALMHFGRSVE